MPRLVALGRHWNVGSDDLVVPAVCTIVLKVACFAAVSVVVYVVHEFHHDFLDDTKCELSLIYVYLAGLLGVLALGTLVDARIACIACKGTIPDDSPRKGIAKYVGCNLLLGVAEAALAVMGTYEVFFAPITNQCRDLIVDAGPVVPAVLNALVITHWASLLLRLCGACITCDCNGGRSKRLRMAASDRDDHRADRWTRRCRHLGCCTRIVHTSGHEVFQEVGMLLAQLFKGADELDLAPSDIVAGLAMVRAKQKQKEDQNIQATVRYHLLHRNGAGEYKSESGSGSGGSGSTEATEEGDLAQLSLASSQVSATGRVKPLKWNVKDQRTSHSTGLNYNSVLDRSALADASHYSRFQLGVYGWMMNVYDHPGTALCSLCCGCASTCLCRCGGNPRVTGDTCLCNQTAFKKVTGVKDRDILYANWANDSVCTVAYAVAIDHKRQSLVITIRGTMSVNDAITDAMADEVDLRLDPEGKALDLPNAKCTAHKGMWNCAKFIAGELAARRVLQRAMGEKPDIVKHIPLLGGMEGSLKLVVTGHSLGAGVATLLGLLLRPKYPELVCWAYAPPGALLSPALADLVAPWCTSVVVGKDLVPRLSVPNLFNLSKDMIDLIRRNRVPKHKVLSSWFCCARRRHMQELTWPADETPSNTGTARIQRYLDTVAHREEIDGDLFPNHRLVLGGKIMHIVKTGTRRRTCCRPSVLRAYEARWADRTDFEKILVSRLMIEDHMPGKMDSCLKFCLHASLRRDHPKRSSMAPPSLHVV